MARKNATATVAPTLSGIEKTARYLSAAAAFLNLAIPFLAPLATKHKKIAKILPVAALTQAAIQLFLVSAVTDETLSVAQVQAIQDQIRALLTPAQRQQLQKALEAQ